MKKMMAAALLALSFTTGFTCSKNTPPPAETEAPAVEEAPAADAAPMEEAPAATEESAPEAEPSH